MPRRRKRTGLRCSAGLLTKRLYNLITVAGQRRIYAGLSPLLPKVFLWEPIFAHLWGYHNSGLFTKKTVKPVSSRTNSCTGRHSYDWLVARTIDLRWCMPLLLLASSVARFTVAGSTPNSIAASKVGLLPKSCDWRAIGARDKLAVSPRRRRWANPPPRKPNLTQHPQLFPWLCIKSWRREFEK